MGGHSQISSLKGAKFGFINKAGKFVIPPVFPCPDFEWSSRFKNGMAQATAEKNATTAFGYINRRGKFVVPAKYSKIEEFSDGLAAFDSCEPGFASMNWNLNRHNSLMQFLRQYEIFSMKRDQIVKLLGEPTSVRKSPQADQYLLSRDCFGSRVFAIRYRADGSVYGYATTWGSLVRAPEEYPPLSDWIATPQVPNVEEDLHSFFKRAAKVPYIPE
jgi:hypothetical protein